MATTDRQPPPESAVPGADRGSADRSAEPTLRLGISACLLGEAVRFDGGHKRDGFLVQTLGRWVDWHPLCPEVEIGLGTPRESLRLVGDPESVRLLAVLALGNIAIAVYLLIQLARLSPGDGVEALLLRDRGGA